MELPASFAVERAPAPPSRIYILRVGDREYAVPSRGVEALLPGDALQPLRYAGDSLVGYVSLEGRESLVFDLHWRLGLARTRPLDDCQLVVVGSGGKLRVYAVAEARGPLRVRPESFEHLAPGGIPAQLGYLRGLLDIDGHHVPWLDFDLLGPASASTRVA